MIKASQIMISFDLFFQQLLDLIFCDITSIKAMLHGAIFLATCNAILLFRDVN
jgi:hypothetical protein